ncbi:translation initiation factor IF-5A [Streptomyces sp. NPDC012765]|uniref:translation initiation factor IF-5A n=1 Tax=Streptomyces sp. NPDC012765 TaxID=3155249 RepID=UPI0033FA684A
MDFELSEADGTTPIQASSVRKGGYLLLKGRPCKITDMSSTTTGKHGHAKMCFVGDDIFTGTRYEDMSPASFTMKAPVVTQTTYSVTGVEGDTLTLEDADGETRTDLPLPKGDLGESIRAQFADGNDITVSVTAAMDTQAVTGFNVMADD